MGASGIQPRPDPRVGPGSREVTQLSPYVRDWLLELTEGDGRTLLETCDLKWHSEMGDECRRGAHPYDVGGLVVHHQRVRGREMARQEVPVTELRADRDGTRARTVVHVKRSRHAVVGRDDDRARAL